MPPSPTRQETDVRAARRWQPLWRILLWPNNLVTLGRGVGVLALVGLHLRAPTLVPPLAAAVAFVLIYWASDHLDGWLARRLNKSSSFGESLDLLVDRLCDLAICATILLTASEHALAVLVFFCARLAPDTTIARYVGLQGDMFRTAARAAPGWQSAFGDRASGITVELNAISKTVFFAWALYFDAPVWSGLLLAVPAALFLCLVGEVLRAHATETYQHWKAKKAADEGHGS